MDGIKIIAHQRANNSVVANSVSIRLVNSEETFNIDC